MNPNVRYYTIAGWSPSLVFNCPQLLGGVGYSQLPKPNDGLVPVSSVESQGYFHNLGHTSNCHSNLLSDKARSMMIIMIDYDNFVHWIN